MLKHFTTTEFQFSINHETGLVDVVINGKTILPILPTSKWSDIKTKIDEILSCVSGCVMCSEKSAKNVKCPKCTRDYCSVCYIKLFKQGEGVITCAHCGFSMGRKLPKNTIDMCVFEIKQKLANV